jgi:hypothetical protein
MTRTKWKRRDAGLWIKKNCAFVGEIIFIALLSIAMASLGICSLKRHEKEFKDATHQTVHLSDPDGSTLVTYVQNGMILGHEFPDRGSALAFAEALQ